MKCPKCQSENKDGVKTCKKCGTDLSQPPLWKPTWQWHLRVLGVIYVVLIVVFFALNSLLKPYLRQIPKDITPWLKDVPKLEKVG
jgi:antibiotic biosynthesis monooxygenase (ABM) superfamily enzyme